jgi:hypothetical protein
MMTAEHYHAICLNEMAAFAEQYLGSRHRARPTVGIFWKFQNINEFILESHGRFLLPPRSGRLALSMARFATCTLAPPEKIIGCDYKIIPEPLFCLHSLLQAAFPKNPDTGVFKPHDCAQSAGEIPSPDAEFRSSNVAFGGLGVLLMRQCQKMHGLLYSDAEILRMCDGYFVSILDDESGKHED